MRIGLIALAIATAACAPRDQVSNESTAALPAEAPAATEPATIETLEGEWRVAGIDGQSLDQPVGLALSASAQEIWWDPRCAGFVRSIWVCCSTA